MEVIVKRFSWTLRNSRWLWNTENFVFGWAFLSHFSLNTEPLHREESFKSLTTQLPFLHLLSSFSHSFTHIYTHTSIVCPFIRTWKTEWPALVPSSDVCLPWKVFTKDGLFAERKPFQVKESDSYFPPHRYSQSSFNSFLRIFSPFHSVDNKFSDKARNYTWVGVWEANNSLQNSKGQQ